MLPLLADYIPALSDDYTWKKFHSHIKKASPVVFMRMGNGSTVAGSKALLQIQSNHFRMRFSRPDAWHLPYTTNFDTPVDDLDLRDAVENMKRLRQDALVVPCLVDQDDDSANAFVFNFCQNEQAEWELLADDLDCLYRILYASSMYGVPLLHEMVQQRIVSILQTEQGDRELVLECSEAAPGDAKIPKQWCSTTLEQMDAARLR